MTYLTLVALMMFVLSPVLVPLVITGVHTIGTCGRHDPSRPAINSEHRAVSDGRLEIRCMGAIVTQCRSCESRIDQQT